MHIQGYIIFSKAKIAPVFLESQISVAVNTRGENFKLFSMDNITNTWCALRKEYIVNPGQDLNPEISFA